MPIPFSRSLRALDADNTRRTLLSIILVVGFFFVWASWFCCARVGVYEVTGDARVETNSSPYTLESPVEGRLSGIHVEVGAPVQEHQVLFTLDDETEALELQEAIARQESLQRQLSLAIRQSEGDLDAMGTSRGGAEASRREALHRLEEARADADLAEREADRLATLAASGAASKAEVQRARAEADAKEAKVNAQLDALSRLGSDQRLGQQTRSSALDQLQREIADLEGWLEVATAVVARREKALKRRQILAPVTGVIGEVATVQPGAILQVGQTLGSVIPPGELRIVAFFRPGQAVGRILPGQRARLRLEGFPWTQYGTVRGTVRKASNEPRDGRVRVVLAVDKVPDRVTLRHGLPGTVEIEVEHISPGALVLRHAGSFLSAPDGDD